MKPGLEVTDQMVTLRQIILPDDVEPITAMDISFATDFCYSVTCSDSCFQLKMVEQRYEKSYHIDLAELAALPYTQVAVHNKQIVGLAAAEITQWNRRVTLHHLYVDRRHRRNGVASALMQSVYTYASMNRARAIWIETQNVNYAAMQFYRSCGFCVCGLDTSLYDPTTVDECEVAIYMMKPVLSC